MNNPDGVGGRRNDGCRFGDNERRLREEHGQGLVEYALILALVSLAAIVALTFLSGKINDLFSKAGNSPQHRERRRRRRYRYRHRHRRPADRRHGLHLLPGCTLRRQRHAHRGLTGWSGDELLVCLGAERGQRLDVQHLVAGGLGGNNSSIPPCHRRGRRGTPHGDRSNAGSMCSASDSGGLRSHTAQRRSSARDPGRPDAELGADRRLRPRRWRDRRTRSDHRGLRRMLLANSAPFANSGFDLLD